MSLLDELDLENEMLAAINLAVHRLIWGDATGAREVLDEALVRAERRSQTRIQQIRATIQRWTEMRLGRQPLPD